MTVAFLKKSKKGLFKWNGEEEEVDEKFIIAEVLMTWLGDSLKLTEPSYDELSKLHSEIKGRNKRIEKVISAEFSVYS